MDETNLNKSAAKETAKDTFLHLLSAAMIYLSVIGFITLWWQIINFLFPDKLNPQGFGSQIYNTLIWGTSALVVAFPVHVLVSWIIGRDFKVNPFKREAQVRKWLWYITLFVSALTIIIDLVTLIFNFLKGDLTTQFFLKLIVVLIAAAAVFGYYLWDLRKRDKTTDLPKKIAWITVGVIFVSIVYGFSLVGSPAKQRDIRFDEQRVGNLQEIQNYLVNYWQQKTQLPKTLGDLATAGYAVPADPETSRQYEYSITGDMSFKLCAIFKTAAAQNAGAGRYSYYSQPGVSIIPQNWEHPIGNACFVFTIDPAFFKQPAGSVQVVPAK